MIVKKTLMVVAAAAAFAAAAGVCVVSLAYALFALMLTWLPPAGAAATVAGAFALLMLIFGLAAMAATRSKAPPPREASFTEKAAEFVRQRPIVSAAAVAVGGFLAVRNPALVAILLKTVLDPKPTSKR